MLFNSLVFVAFFAIVYAAYLATFKQHRIQNALLLVASWFFYGWWDWRFLGLLAISTLVDFYIGRALGALPREEQHARRRKQLLLASVATNLGLLGFFKYFNFFAQSVQDLLQLFGMQADPFTLKIILPVGISFYTFQTMSYTIDIYRGRLEPTDKMLEFALFVSFFPQLVAGPIERASRLLPQILRPRKLTVDLVSSGGWLVLWGYFKKVTIADNVGPIADQIFSNSANYSDLDIVLGVVAFSIQIYCDFSGYSDIARGLSRLMGFDLMVNFRLPYFAVTPSDFWQRWHISLSTWLRDYLYIPLGGNRSSGFGTYRNLVITMLLGGLWHGPAWNFVLWGAFHGLILVLYRPFDRYGPRVAALSRASRALLDIGRGAIMLGLTLYGWLLFRASSAAQIASMTAAASFDPTPLSKELASEIAFFAMPLVIADLAAHLFRDLLVVPKLPLWARIPLYSAMIVWIFIFGARESMEFIYFQF